MALRLINTHPGTSQEDFIPGDKIYMGLRSETGNVNLGSVNIKHGVSGISHRALIPTQDSFLVGVGVQTTLDTVERKRPVGPNLPVEQIISNNLVLTKTSNSDFDKGIYEVYFPFEDNSPTLAYIKLKTNTALTTFSPDWCNLTSMTGFYFGLEHGTYNTACYAFLRGSGSGSLVVGGPLSVFLSPRPSQTELPAFDWKSLPNGTDIEIWIYFSTQGNPPSFVPTAQVWTKRGGVDSAPVYQFSVPIGSLGTFPTQAVNAFNYREGTGSFVRMFMGNAGKLGDSLEFVDWALFPYFPFCVTAGTQLPNHDTIIKPDLPYSFNASANQLLDDYADGRWFNLNYPGLIAPNNSLVFNPGTIKKARAVSIRKTTTDRFGFERQEPRIESVAPVSSTDGFSIELFCASELDSIAMPVGVDEITTGVGFGADDRSKLFNVILLRYQSEYKLGILADGNLLNKYLPASYHVANEVVDWRTSKTIRLTVDRIRQKIHVYLDERRLTFGSNDYLDLTSVVLPTSTSLYGKLFVGHLQDTDVKCSFDISKINYLSRFKAWEIADGTPVSSPLPWTSTVNNDGSGSSSAGSEGWKIAKRAFGTSNSYRYYSRLESFIATRGFQVDTEFKLLEYSSSDGELFKQSSRTGSGISVFTGSQVFTAEIINCGLNGYRLCVIPKSLTIDQLVSQTKDSLKFSTKIDPLVFNKIRIAYVPYDSIKIWVNQFNADPDIVIPWSVQGFDLPDSLTANSIRFGHFDHMTSSITEWKYFRYGLSNGYNASIVQKYPLGTSSYMFGGKSVVIPEFSE